MTEILAVLWDLDGVLVDTQENHFVSWGEVLRDYGASMSREMFTCLFGMNNRRTVEVVLGRSVSDELFQSISYKKETIFRDLMKDSICLMPGVETWLNWIYAHHIPQAIASSAPPENIDQVLDTLNVRHLFQAVVPGYGHPSKPDPWVFQTASRQLSVDGGNCLVVEDSIAGVQAAKAICATCLAVTSTNGAEKLYAAGADRVVHTLEEIAPGELIGA